MLWKTIVRYSKHKSNILLDLVTLLLMFTSLFYRGIKTLNYCDIYKCFNIYFLIEVNSYKTTIDTYWVNFTKLMNLHKQSSLITFIT